MACSGYYYSNPGPNYNCYSSPRPSANFPQFGDYGIWPPQCSLPMDPYAYYSSGYSTDSSPPPSPYGEFRPLLVPVPGLDYASSSDSGIFISKSSEFKMRKPARIDPYYKLKFKNLKTQNPDTSSAYNTGESCRSNSISPEAIQSINDCADCGGVARSPRRLHRSQQVSEIEETQTITDEIYSNHVPSTFSTIDRISIRTPGYAEPQQRPMVTPPSQNPSPSGLRRFAPLKLFASKDSSEFAKRFRIPQFSIVLKDAAGKLKKKEIKQPSPVVPPPKPLARTSNKLFMFDCPINELSDLTDYEQPGPSSPPQQPENPEDEPVQFKWKVKRRSDGTRYVVKRPLRSQVLKKREAQLIKERIGLSTDDDAMSELKLGHFHRREDRKKHLEREKQRKEKQQLKLLLAKTIGTDNTIVQMSKRKMEKKKDQMLLDGFVTTQEVLSQRNTSHPGKHGILSVTTV